MEAGSGAVKPAREKLAPQEELVQHQEGEMLQPQEGELVQLQEEEQLDRVWMQRGHWQVELLRKENWAYG